MKEEKYKNSYTKWNDYLLNNGFIKLNGQYGEYFKHSKYELFRCWIRERDGILQIGKKDVDKDYTFWFADIDNISDFKTIFRIVCKDYIDKFFENISDDLLKEKFNKYNKLSEKNKSYDMLEELKEYFRNTPREKVLADWEKSKEYDNVGITVDEFLEQYKTIVPMYNTVKKISYSTDITNLISSGEYKDKWYLLRYKTGKFDYIHFMSFKNTSNITEDMFIKYRKFDEVELYEVELLEHDYKFTDDMLFFKTDNTNNYGRLR